MERTHAWGNQYGKLRWCTERRRIVVQFWLTLAAAAIVCGRLVRRAWTSYRWDGRPRRRPYHLLAQAYANLPPRIVVSPGPTGNPTQMLVPLGKKFPRSLVSVPCMRLRVMVPV